MFLKSANTWNIFFVKFEIKVSARKKCTVYILHESIKRILKKNYQKYLPLGLYKPVHRQHGLSITIFTNYYAQINRFLNYFNRLSVIFGGENHNTRCLDQSTSSKKYVNEFYEETMRKIRTNASEQKISIEKTTNV